MTEKDFKIVYSFLDNFFPDIDGALLFGSYIISPEKAHDVDLLLVSEQFASGSRESYIFENIKFNPIKFRPSEVFNILSENYKRGDFYRIVFQEGIIVVDKKKEIAFFKNYIDNYYPKTRQDDLALGLNNVLLNIIENNTFLKKELPIVEFYMVASDTISNLLDYFLVTKGIYPNKSPKLKSRYLEANMPIENKKIQDLLCLANQNNQKEFHNSLQSLISYYTIPTNTKHSNDLIFDDYTLPELLLYLENLYDFKELENIILLLKKENINFYIYQVDEGSQEKRGCYIVFDNKELIFEKNRQYWIDFIKTNFANFTYTFPYNDIFCFPEIKFMGKSNELMVRNLLTKSVEIIKNNSLTKEVLLIHYLRVYIEKSGIKMNDIYYYFLGKLNAKSRSSNYFHNKMKESEAIFFKANKSAKNKIVTIFKNAKSVDLSIDFEIITNAPLWLHFQVIDRLISILLKSDFEKLFYVYCLKKVGDE